MKLAPGFYLIGTQRSGSNLLRVMLDQSDTLAAPHPPHVMQSFFPLLSLYGDLGHATNWNALVKDAAAWVAANPIAWEGFSPDPQLFGQLNPRTLPVLTAALYSSYALSRGKTAWLNKSMANVHFGPQILADFPDARFIYLYRDGRDVALSFSRTVPGPKHPLIQAREWVADQTAALQLRKRLPAGQFFSLSYEALIDQPEQTLQRLCDWMGIRFLPDMLRYYLSDESRRTAEGGNMWANVARPVLPANQQKYLREAAPEAVALFEQVAGGVLRQLGYPVGAAAFGAREPNLTLNWEQAEVDDRALRAAARAQAPPEDLLRRKPQEDLLNCIRAKQPG